MSDTKPRPSSFRLEARVQKVVDALCADEYRTISNTVNLLVIEALTARGLWPAQNPTNHTKEA